LTQKGSLAAFLKLAAMIPVSRHQAFSSELARLASEAGIQSHQRSAIGMMLKTIATAMPQAMGDSAVSTSSALETETLELVTLEPETSERAESEGERSEFWSDAGFGMSVNGRLMVFEVSFQ